MKYPIYLFVTIITLVAAFTTSLFFFAAMFTKTAERDLIPLFFFGSAYLWCTFYCLYEKVSK